VILNCKKKNPKTFGCKTIQYYKTKNGLNVNKHIMSNNKTKDKLRKNGLSMLNMLNVKNLVMLITKKTKMIDYPMKPGN
jgi:hypothetical protein